MAYLDIERRKEVIRAHYRANDAVYKARAKAHNAKTAVAIREHVLSYLLCHPCVDCGEADPVVLDFDHRDGQVKRFNLGDAPNRGFSLKSVIAEIAKCDVRCANCHRRVTYKRAGYTHRG